MLKLFFFAQLEALALYIGAYILVIIFIYFAFDYSLVKDDLITVAKFFFPTFILYGVVLFSQSLRIKNSKE